MTRLDANVIIAERIDISLAALKIVDGGGTVHEEEGGLAVGRPVFPPAINRNTRVYDTHGCVSRIFFFLFFFSGHSVVECRDADVCE